MRTVAVILLFLAGLAGSAQGADDLSKHETWITGQVLNEKGTLLFRADKPVRGNTAGKVVLLGASKATVKVLLPVYAQAAEKHVRLRLYGVLLPAPGPPAKGMPGVEFITWKVHVPSDPDELPTDQKIILHEGDEVEGVPARLHPQGK